MTMNTLIGNAINWAGNFLSSGSSASARALEEQYQYNLALQREAQRWNEYAYKHRYQWQVEDYKEAGINKLYGLGTAPAITTGMNSVDAPQYVAEQKNRQEAIQAGLEFGMNWTALQTKMAKEQAETDNEIQQTELVKLEQVNQEINNMRNQKELDKWDEQYLIKLEQQKAEIQENLAKAEEHRANALNAREQAGTEKSKRKALESQAEYTDEQTKFTKAQGEATARKNAWHQKHPMLSDMAVGGEEMSSFNDAVQGYMDSVAGLINPFHNRGVKKQQEMDIKERRAERAQKNARQNAKGSKK